MKQLFVIILFLLFTTLHSQECDTSFLKSEYAKLESLINSIHPKKALSFSDSLLNIITSEGYNNCDIYYWVLYLKAESLEMIFEFEQPLMYYYEILHYAEEHHNYLLEAETYLCIARVHEFLDRPLDCQRNLAKAKDIILKHQLWGSYSRYAVRYSSYNRLFASRDTAIHYAQVAIQYGTQYKRVRSELDGHLLLGILTEDLDVSIDYFRKAIDLFLQRGAFYGAASQRVNVASNLFDAGRYDEALTETNEVIAYIKKYVEDSRGSSYLLYKGYDLKKSIYNVRGNLDSTYYYSELSHEYHIKANRLTDQQKISQIEIDNAIKTEQFQLKQVRKQAKLLQWLLILGACIVVLIGTLYYLNIRNRIKIDNQNKLIQLKNQELEVALNEHATLLSEVHHRVKNNLQLIISLLTIQAEKSESELTKIQLTNLSDKIKSIALIHDQLYKKGEFDTINIEDYCEDLFKHFGRLINDSSLFHYQLVCDNISLNLETVMPLGIIISELLANSLKYAKSSDGSLKVSLKIKQEGDLFKLIYNDDGPGYAQHELAADNNSMGSMLIFSMTRQLLGKIRTFNSDGAIFEMEFKEKKVSTI